MSGCDHDFKRHPNHDFLRCIECGRTVDEAIDQLLDDAAELLDPTTPGTATERQGAAMRRLVKAKRMERRYE